MSDRALIRDVIENWAVWRDSGDFDRLGTCWHANGHMVTTWGRFAAPDFVAASRAAWERGIDVVHLLGGTAIDLTDWRAVAQTKMTIQQRGDLDGVLVDVTCTGRFYDFFERRDGRWAIMLRQPIYERDRMDPATSGERVELAEPLLGSFPSGYRHLGYFQSRAGMTVSRDLPGLRGPAVEALYARGKQWLSGGPLD